ncbi:MAG: DinB family protein [Gemmatimonadota bacterium]|nr:DinB family protein [Gemmatimonadota bacterium]
MRQRLSELLSYMDESRSKLLATVDESNSALSTMRVRDGEWSVAEILAHLAIVERGVARLVARAVTRARENGVVPETDDSSIMSTIDHFAMLNMAKKRAAPAIVVPAAGTSADESLESLVQSRIALRKALADADGLDLCAVKSTHVTLGELDMYQWGLFVAQHEMRHRAQIDRTIREVTGRAAECAPIV